MQDCVSSSSGAIVYLVASPEPSVKHVKYVPVHHFVKAGAFRIPESAGRIDDSRISLTCLPLLLKLLEIPFNVREGMFPTHDAVMTNQRETKRKEKWCWTIQCQTT